MDDAAAKYMICTRIDDSKRREFERDRIVPFSYVRCGDTTTTTTGRYYTGLSLVASDTSDSVSRFARRIGELRDIVRRDYGDDVRLATDRRSDFIGYSECPDDCLHRYRDEVLLENYREYRLATNGFERRR